MKRFTTAVLALAALATIGWGAYATAFRGDPVNDKCPLKGEEVAGNQLTDVKLKFCSEACQMKFEKDPAPYVGKIGKVPNTTCPVDAKAPKDVQGTLTVAFCCGNCKDTFDGDISKYMGKVKARKGKK